MGLIRDFKDYCVRKPLRVLAVYLIFVALFGMWTFHHMVTFDAEGFFSIENGAKWYEQWMTLGRWGFVALKRVLRVTAINPYFSTGLFILLFPMSALVWSFALERWAEDERPGWVAVLFCTLFLSHPVWAQQFAYRNQMEVMSVALVLAPVGMLQLGEFLDGRGRSFGIGAIAVASFLFGCYQSFIFVYVEAVCILLFLRLRSGRVERPWRELVWCIAVVVMGFALCTVIGKVVVFASGVSADSSYLSDQFMWGKRGVLENLRQILTYIKHSAFGDGIHYGVTFAVEAAALLGVLISMFRRGHDHMGFAALVMLGILASPFVLEVVTAGDVVIRSQFAFVLALAFLGAFELDLVAGVLAARHEGALTALAVAAVALAAVVFQAQQQTRLLYTDVRTMDKDHETMTQIYYQAMAHGARPGDALCLVGGLNTRETDDLTEGEVIGYSYFEVSNDYGPGKTIEAMQAYGFDVTIPTREQMDAAEAERDSLNAWPSSGSLAVHDGYYVARLS